MGRGAPAVLLLLVACIAPTGAERHGCNAEWLDAPAVIAQPIGTGEQAIAIDCLDQIKNRRLRVGFFLPTGPDCHVLRRVELVESAEAVAITLIGGVDDSPTAGACPEEPRRVVTEVDLAAPLDDRALLDGSS
jgi:hypothetical protein